MPFLLMVFLTVVCLPEAKEWPEPWGVDSPAWSAALTGLGMLLTVLHARRVCGALLRGLRGGPAGRENALRRYERGRTRHLLLVLGVYVLSLVGLGWGWTVAQLWQGRPAAEVLILAPFLLAELLSWAIFYDADRACAQPAARPADLDPLGLPGREPEFPEPATFGSRASHVLFQARQKLALVFLPVLLLIVHKELHRLFPEEEGKAWDIASVTGCVALAAVFLTLPWVVRLLLGLRPLPDGPLRARLLASSRRLGFRCSNLLVWNTRSGMANAMVIGLLPWIRYVVFTDRLLEDFSPDEVEAVFGHEVGHVKHQHMLYYLGFLLGSVFILGSLVQMADAYLNRGPSGGWVAAVAKTLTEGGHRYLAVLPLVAILLSYIFVVFGFLSRRCERQADVFGCRAVSCALADCPGHGAGTPLAERGRSLCPTGIRTFIRALEKVALVNGISRDRPGFLQSWQHSTIARRVEFLQGVLCDPAAEVYFQRRVAAVKWALFAGLGTAIYLLYHLAPKLLQE
jgi:Zn-dependent protease with chaperone function